jgi:hypothetical protein
MRGGNVVEVIEFIGVDYKLLMTFCEMIDGQYDGFL